jgi:hypothetical protein
MYNARVSAAMRFEKQNHQYPVCNNNQTLNDNQRGCGFSENDIALAVVLSCGRIS